MRRFSTSIATIATTATLGLAACGGPGAPANPSDAVAQGLDARLQDGFSFDLSFELTDAGRDSLVRDSGEDVAQLLEGGLLSGSYQPPDKMAIAIGGDEAWLEVRTLGEEIYFRIDLAGLQTLTGEDMQIPSAVELQAMLGEMGLQGEIAAVAQAAVQGDWVGVTGLTEEAMQGLSEQFGVPMPTPDPQASEDIRAALERAGLLDGDELTERYLIVTGGEDAYEVEVKARALVTALMDVAGELEQYAEGFTSADMPDTADIPEQIGGVTITLDGNKADLVTLDLVEIASAFDEASVAEEGLTEGDVQLIVDFDDLDTSQVAAPEGATTITFEALMEGLAPLFMGLFGGMGGQF